MNKLIVISGCSGGGKSTLLAELKHQGYAVVEEVGRTIVKEYGDMDPQVLCEMIIEKSITAYHQAEQMRDVKEGMIFFDRSFLEGISYFQSVKIHKYDHFINELRYYPVMFITPPWKEIFIQDAE